ncbi:MAG TPA: 16S rRNA (cytidine(1402)-2'-O)-methyltransferase [Chloroflexota bacterium]
MSDGTAARPGTLYLVGTPIGNLEDVTLRALRILREVPVIAAEDTRHTRTLLAHYDIHKPLISYFEQVEQKRLGTLLERLREGDVALVSDAGMPSISDPGYALVRAAIAAGIPVVPIPGPSAPIAALAASGLPTDQFVYLGFLPRRSSDRRKLLGEVTAEPRTLIAFETPHRLVAVLDDVEAVLGDRPVVVARELTKLHEEFLRGTANRVRQQILGAPIRGEITLLIGGAAPGPSQLAADALAARVQDLVDAGRSTREIVEQLSREPGASRREVYRLLLEVRNCAKI